MNTTWSMADLVIVVACFGPRTSRFKDLGKGAPLPDRPLHLELDQAVELYGVLHLSSLTIGSTKPFTIILAASASLMPRLIR